MDWLRLGDAVLYTVLALAVYSCICNIATFHIEPLL